MSQNRIRAWSGRIFYGVVLFVLAFSALEQFSQLNEDFGFLSKRQFHLLMAGMALAAAVFEAWKLMGLGGLKEYFNNPEFIVEPPPLGKYEFRRSCLEEIDQIHNLAKERYGSYSFTKEKLRAWFLANRNCFFIMLYNDSLVGYIDAFPISEKDYHSLLKGKDETSLTPEAEPTATSSFYIASYVIKAGFEGKSLVFLNRAINFYDQAYPIKAWDKICAVAYTARGLSLLQKKGMVQISHNNMFYVDRKILSHLTPKNQQFWQRLLPPKQGTTRNN